MKVLDQVRIIEGASKWMKKRGYWIKDWPESIDGLEGLIVNDYTHLPGDDSHYEVEIEGVYGCGVHPQFLITVD